MGIREAMGLTSVRLAAACGLVFLLGAFVSLASPPAYVHPDEQSAGLPASKLAGTHEPLPPDLADHEPWFRPYNVIVHGREGNLSTAFLASSGIGFAYPIFLAPFLAAGGFWAAYLSGPLCLALLYAGAVLFLDPRRSTSWSLALLPLAIPPVLLHAGLLFSNLPGLAFFVLGIGLAAEGLRGRAWLLVPAILSMAWAAALRLDYIVALLAGVPVVALLVLAGAPRGRLLRTLAALALALMAALAAGLVVFRILNGTWGLPYAHLGRPTTNASSVSQVTDRAREVWEGVQEVSTDSERVRTADAYLFGLVPGLLALGLAALLRPRRDHGASALVLPLALQGIVVWGFAAGAPHYGSGCACIDGSQPRYFLPIYVAAALLAARFLADALDRLPRPAFRPFLAAGLAGMLFVAGAGHAYQGEQGILWIHHMREFHNLYEEAAHALPEDAVVAGNYLSKLVHARPVLVPDATPRFPQAVDHVLSLERPVYVDIGWLVPGKDGAGEYGQQLLRSGRHVLVHSGVKDYYEVVRTNATVRQVFDLLPGDWSVGNETLRALESPAHFRVVDRPGGSLPQEGFTQARARVVVTFLDDAPRTIGAGYVNFDSNSTVPLAAWEATGSGEWVTHEFVIDRGLVVTGAAYLTGAPTLKRLEVTWT